MTIHIQCPVCSHPIKAPESAIGRKGKCPQCGHLFVVAKPSPPPISQHENDPFADLSPTSPFRESLDSPQEDPFQDISQPANPFAPPKPVSFVEPSPGLRFQGSSGAVPAWITGPGIGALFSTAKDILLKPFSSFAAMAGRGTLGNAIGFSVAAIALFGLVTIIQAVGDAQVLGRLAQQEGPGQVLIGDGELNFENIAQANQAPVGKAIYIGAAIGQAIGGIIGAIVGLFIAGGIWHLSLTLVGGANQGYQETVRAVAFGPGSGNVAYATVMLPFMLLFMVIQLASPSVAVYGISNILVALFGIVFGIWGMVATICGFSRLHGISGGKATLAYFIPVIFCCGGIIVLSGIIGGIAGVAAVR
ncbi:MAG: YIP1 family protein [Pirellulaceae bacterium]|nr:YIP1 family protein [Pirellulaceae bacterium]